ncbi:MAG: ArsR family transcriptional regulator [Campylobacterales bacterium]|nr:ArsR family transcriptional regulator [Campylobacterales bacterium]
MLEGNDRPLRFKRKASKKNQMWGYMRRNRSFRVGDVMSILDLSLAFCKQTLWYLSETGYVRLENDVKTYKDRIYTLVNDTGVKCPSMIDNKVYDYNIDKEYEIYTRSASDTETLILLAIAPEGSKIGEIINETKLPRSTVGDYLKKLLEKRLIRKAPKQRYERCGQ